MKSPDAAGRQQRRTFSELPGKKGRKDVDATEISVRVYAAMGAIPGFFLGGLLGLLVVAKGMAPTWMAVLFPFGGAAVVYFGVLTLVGNAGRAAMTLHAPSGKTTPPKKEYSQAESLVIRGQYEEGISAFEMAILEDARDPTPYLRIARVYRDHLSRFDDSARWFRKAFREAVITPGLAALARKELVELYTHRLGQPERALPELARMAEELSGTDEGAWAAGELAEIKSRMSSPESPAAPAVDPETTP